MKRRSFVKGSLSASVAGLAIGAGILPTSLLVEATDATKTKKAKSNFDKAIVSSAETSDKIKLEVPNPAVDGSIVPIIVKATGIEGVTAIQIIAMNNPDPLVGSFNLGEGTLAYTSARIKMGKTGSVVALVTAGDKTFKAEKVVRVIFGCCGG